ncbi:hypothetical protein SAMN05444166_4994 [Singulisphaera sp. GP187]|uniref:glycosyltransferase family 39 protein n=1 Tax=Singulisphaera sp. GP187 TaxID=1882752 RepID=UPI0009273CE4|nr:glycosyltransferase family 39 protein [Singulisphaera sp. GP187]SIO46839.1 hypothetical protein SAMN05444166_4994 [Singulisphaera sp. GP187]
MNYLGKHKGIWRCVACLAATVGFFAAMIPLSGRKFMGFDENFTYRIARLNSAEEIWRRMADGLGETNPPFMHIVAHYALLSPLDPDLAIRLPSMIGYWVMVACVFRFALRRVSRLNAGVAASLSLCQFQYAVEGRVYGLLLGLAGVSLLFWRSTVENRRPALDSLALGSCFAIASFAHFYGFMIMVPFGFAELARSRGNLKASLPILGSFAIGLTPLVAILPFARYARTWSPTFWGRPHAASSLWAYHSLCGIPLTLVLVVGCLCVAGAAVLRARSRVAPVQPGFRHYEVVLFCTAALMPVWVHGMSIFTNAYSPRYAIVMIVGIALLGATVLHEAERHGSLLHGICILIALESLGYHVNHDLARLHLDHVAMKASMDTVGRILREDPNAICIVTEHHLYLRIQRYLDQDQGGRVYGYCDSERAGAMRTVLELCRIANLQFINMADVENVMKYDEHIVRAIKARNH